VDAQSIWYAIAVLLVLLGLAGILLPAIPGLPLVFLGMLVAAWAGGFEQVGGWTLLALATLTLVSIGIDFLAFRRLHDDQRGPEAEGAGYPEVENRIRLGEEVHAFEREQSNTTGRCPHFGRTVAACFLDRKSRE